MSQATLAWAAFKNMMRQAARDPFWALVQIIFAPIRGGIYVMQIILGVGIIVLILGFCLRYLLGNMPAIRPARSFPSSAIFWSASSPWSCCSARSPIP
jgi:hypothetical protein